MSLVSLVTYLWDFGLSGDESDGFKDAIVGKLSSPILPKYLLRLYIFDWVEVEQIEKGAALAEQFGDLVSKSWLFCH